MSLFAPQLAMLDLAAPLEVVGRVQEVRGLAVYVSDLAVPVGAMVRLESQRGATIWGEVIGFDTDHTIVMLLGSPVGVRAGDRVIAGQFQRTVRVGPGLIGRVLNGLGQPIDGRGPITQAALQPLSTLPLHALDRQPIQQPLATGIRAIDALLSIGRGQRVGIFSAAGVGKSTLLAMMARHTAADLSVVALVGERGREVREFLDNTLGPEGLARSVVVVATGDEPALLRVRAALVATAIAEYFRDQGMDVLLLMDSLTRFCQAQRQIGLAAGEPPATKGYPPSVFAMLPQLLERSGRTSRGSITGLYAVLVEADDMNEPIADAARSVLDGHIVLSRRLAARGHWPAVDVLESISRCTLDVTDPEHQAARQQVLSLLAAYREVEDLLNIGAYAAGSNPEYDLAIACKPAIDQLLRQGLHEVHGLADFQRTRQQLLALAQQIQQTRLQQLRQQQQQPQRPATAASTRR